MEGTDSLGLGLRQAPASPTASVSPCCVTELKYSATLGLGLQLYKTGLEAHFFLTPAQNALCEAQGPWRQKQKCRPLERCFLSQPAAAHRDFLFLGLGFLFCKKWDNDGCEGFPDRIHVKQLAQTSATVKAQNPSG